MTATNPAPAAAPVAPKTTATKPKKEFFWQCAATDIKYCMRIAENIPQPYIRATIIRIGVMSHTCVAYHELPLCIYQSWVNGRALSPDVFMKALEDLIHLQKNFL
jgi:hypothetical protein